MTNVRCAAASLAREDDLAGTASNVRSFLLLEHSGPWGYEALRDARLPAGLGEHLTREGRRTGVRVLLVRRPGRRAVGTGVRVLAARAAGARSWMEAATVSSPEELRSLDLRALGAGRSPGLPAYDAPLIAVCTHGRHDACCAERGRPVALALATSRHADAVWECSHIGGDRFAGNVLVLPRGLYYGRVDPAAALVLARTVADGHLDLTHLRGRSDLSMPMQAAEIEVRRRLGLTGLDDVSPTAATTDGDVTTVTLNAGGRRVRAHVRRVLSEPQRLTCAATRDSAVPRFEVALQD